MGVRGRGGVGGRKMAICCTNFKTFFHDMNMVFFPVRNLYASLESDSFNFFFLFLLFFFFFFFIFWFLQCPFIEVCIQF